MAMNAPATPPSAPATPPPAAQPAAPTAPATPPNALPANAQPAAPAPHQGTQTAPQTLQQVLEARRAALNPEAAPAPAQSPDGQPNPNPAQPQQPQAPEAPQTPPESPANAPQTPTPEQLAAQAAMFQLAQQNPQQLIQMLQAAQPQPENKPQPDAPARPTPEQYHQTLLAEAQQHIQARPPITAKGLFGEDNAEELGLGNKDFSGDLEAFVQATMAPVLGTLLSQLYALQHHFDQQFTQVRPVLETHQFTEVQREAGKQLEEAFPALKARDPQAVAYCDKRFNELAPILLPPEILNNPQSNPKEYARIMTSIARIAASEFASVPPAQAPAPSPTIPAPASVPPEPQQIAPAYRNHLGQFKANQAPRTLDEYNQKRIETLFPKR